jgi:hypothetical protein
MSVFRALPCRGCGGSTRHRCGTRSGHSAAIPATGGTAINGQPTAQVDIFSVDARFITSAECELSSGAEGAPWRGMLTGIEPNKRLISGRYKLRSRGGREATIVIQARQRIGQRERYPFVGEGTQPEFD